jgi:hypothetical protein
MHLDVVLHHPATDVASLDVPMISTVTRVMIPAIQRKQMGICVQAVWNASQEIVLKDSAPHFSILDFYFFFLCYVMMS